jgi:hypothetical protein
MNFSALVDRVKLVVEPENNEDTLIEKLLREAENDFIENTLCLQRISYINTLSTFTYDITAVATNTITVAGDQADYFIAGESVEIAGSTGNDGTYTIVSAAYTTSTAITIEEDLTDSTVDGEVSLVRPLSTYTLPSDFVNMTRIEWEGELLKPISQTSLIEIHDNNNDESRGYPMYYWVEDENLRLVPAPDTHGTINLWYYYNNQTETTAPLIPANEHIKLIDYAIASYFEIRERENRATYYWERYYKHLISAKNKYASQKYRQDKIYEENGSWREYDQHLSTSEYNWVNE